MQQLGHFIDGLRAVFRLQRQRAIDAGHDLDRVLTTDDLVTSDNCYFAATGITDGDLLRGVRYRHDRIVTESIVMRSRSGTIRTIRSEHRLEKLRAYSATAADLDTVSPDHPVLLHSRDHHMLWVNSRALALAAGGIARRRDARVPRVRKARGRLDDAADRQAAVERLHHLGGMVGAAVVNQQELPRRAGRDLHGGGGFEDPAQLLGPVARAHDDGEAGGPDRGRHGVAWRGVGRHGVVPQAVCGSRRSSRARAVATASGRVAACDTPDQRVPNACDSRAILP